MKSQKFNVTHEKDKGIPNTDFRVSNLKRVVFKELVDGSVLDVGSGSGWVAFEALKQKREVTCVDVSEELIEKLAENFEAVPESDLKLFWGRAEEMCDFVHDAFDNITCIDVLEHINDDEKVLKNMCELLKDSGRIVIIVPAIKRLWSERDESHGHYRRYDEKEILRKVHDSGLKVLKVGYWNCAGAVIATVKKSFGIYFKEDVIRFSRNPFAVAVNSMLDVYFFLFENSLWLPFGLNLVVVCEKEVKG